MGQTVNLLSFDFGGSNPSLPTSTNNKHIPSFLRGIIKIEYYDSKKKIIFSNG